MRPAPKSRGAASMDLKERGLLIEESTKPLADGAREHPYRYCGIALGLGFVLGGGLATRLGGHLLDRMARATLLPLVVKLVTSGGRDETEKFT